MIITYRKNSGEVVMTGQDINNEFLESVEVQDDERILQGYIMKYEKGKLSFEKNPLTESEENKVKIQQEFNNDLQLIEKSKTISELKTIITKLASKVYNQ